MLCNRRSLGRKHACICVQLRDAAVWLFERVARRRRYGAARWKLGHLWELWRELKAPCSSTWCRGGGYRRKPQQGEVENHLPSLRKKIRKYWARSMIYTTRVRGMDAR